MEFVAFLLQGLPRARLLGVISPLDLMASMHVFAEYRTFESSRVTWLESLMIPAIAYFGGSTLVGIIANKPPVWTGSDGAAFGFLISWLLIFFSPNDVWFRLFRWRPIHATFVVFDTINHAHCVSTFGVDHMVGIQAERGTRSIILCVLAGMLTLAGGGIVTSLIKIWPEPNRKPRLSREATVATTFGYHRMVVSTLLYFFILRDPLSLTLGEGVLMSKNTALVVLTLVMLVGNLLHEYNATDIYKPLIDGSLKATGVPMSFRPLGIGDGTTSSKGPSRIRHPLSPPTPSPGKKLF